MNASRGIHSMRAPPVELSKSENSEPSLALSLFSW